MGNLLWEDIQAQSDNLLHVIEHLYGRERDHLEKAGEFLRNDRPIALIGVASAAYLCMPAEFYWNKCGRYASLVNASDAFYDLLPMLRHANVVINSRSGETVEIVKLGRALTENDIPFIAITNEPESTLAGMASHVVWSNTRKDELVSINVVTGMMITTLALASASIGRLDEIYLQLDQLGHRMPDVIQRARDQADELLDLLKSIRPLYLIYRGASKGSAHCGRLVLEEVSRFPSIPLEAAEFRQGPNEVIDERFGAVIFVPEGQPGNLNRSLGEDILRSGGRVLFIGNVNQINHPNARIFPIPGIPDELRPVLEIVPLQFLAFHLAQSQGYTPGEVRYISKVILNEEGIPNQT